MRKSLIECALSVRRGEVTVTELVSTAGKNIQDLARLNAFLEVDTERAMKHANMIDSPSSKSNHSLIRGSILSVKDNFMMKDSRTTAGSRMLESLASSYDATVVTRLEDAGGVMLGKTNMDEFGMGSASLNSAFGNVQSPWGGDDHVVAGGSSGGGAAAVASFLSHGSVGSDTGGSVRQPASFCGCVGLKPTYGLLSRYGLLSYASSMDCPGIMTRSVLDAAVLLDTMSGHDENDPSSLLLPEYRGHGVIPQILGEGSDDWDATTHLEALLNYQATLQSLEGVTIGVPGEFHAAELDPRIHDIWNDTLHQLQDAGATIKPISIPSLTSALPTYYMLACAEASSNLSRYDGIRYGYRSKPSTAKKVDSPENSASIASLASELHNEIAQTRGEAFGAEVLRRILTGTFVLSQSAFHDYYEKALHSRNALTEAVCNQFTHVDCLLGPTSPVLPFYSSKPPSVSDMYYNDILTVPANLAGLPAVSVPAGIARRNVGNTDEPAEMPVGMQLIGTRLGECELLRVALAIEQRNGLGDECLPTMLR